MLPELPQLAAGADDYTLNVHGFQIHRSCFPVSNQQLDRLVVHATAPREPDYVFNNAAADDDKNEMQVFFEDFCRGR